VSRTPTCMGRNSRSIPRALRGRSSTTSQRSGVYRIVALGDSCTFGTGFWRVSYPGVLQRLLDASASSRRFEVINAGIEGYNSTFALERIRDELLQYKPRLMLLYIGWNDLMKIDPRMSRGRRVPMAGDIFGRELSRQSIQKLLS